MASQGGGSGGSSDPWAWLGLLKWSLNYVDGTRDNSDAVPMSAEDREFLEKVMKEGIIDENERMKEILRESAATMEYYKTQNTGGGGGDPPLSTDDLEDLFQELRDYESSIPQSIRSSCLGILSTLAQNNPHVQRELLEMGACKTLSDLFFASSSSASSKSLQAKVMQAMSSMVRNNEIAEEVFCKLPQAPALFMKGLALSEGNNSTSLRTKSLFFLKALLTSDASTPERVKTFQTAIIHIVDHYLDVELSPDLREMAISLLEQVFGRTLLSLEILAGGRKDVLVARAVQRIAQIRALTGEGTEFAQTELEHWENLLVVLARG
eukprot:CAMPEP_0117069882 /NCGR_PEP_ID=MMETSP0472-20121206/49044_1 /TAXON_ID=693140 ORGANISM="Tiarina fusus, Strain LIS" /NCGR_SAMPLE_ID=MMETSP0472 /ASSEMBLY_ACC=CAM_ASM_000603 /LENGTH=322 /DNA_ID=CAMNT_0004792659 /DNA_START=197 /DNA_END=1165 /DNA_ORIENTATION=-